MVKKTAVILGILAMLAIGCGISWGYTVSKWPVPGIPNTVYTGGSPCLPGAQCGGLSSELRGPVAPSCEPPLIPGIIHAGLSLPFRALGLALSPLFTGTCPGQECCNVPLGEPAYVLAAVPCTPVNAYIAPKCW